MNKVLNRPLFRKEALRKGALKPIHAQIGTMVGMPTGGSTAYNPNRVPMVVPQETRMNRFGRAVKQFPGKVVRDVGRFPGGLITDPKGTVMGTRPFGMGGGLSRLLGFEGIYSTIDPYVGQYIKNPTARFLTSTALTGVASLNPYIRAAGMAKSAYGLGKSLIYNPIKASMVKNREAGSALPDISDEASMENAASMSEPVKEPAQGMSSTAKPGSGRIGFNRLNVAENKDPSENNLIDIDKVVKNNMPSGVAPVPPKQPEVKVVKIDEKIKEDPKEGKVTEKVTVASGEAPVVSKPGKVTASDGTEVTDDVIQRAREIRAELMAGKSSQAKLVFLANLASGLMSGTTAKAGIGGALEVFGKALGPAVNNYVTVKLKENEMENEFMSDALELAADEFAAKNAVLESPEFQKYGIIQYSDENGNVRNITGGMLKNGSYVVAIPGAVDQNGMQQYQTVPVGSFDRFLDSDYAVKEQGQTLRNLSGKYKALNLGNTTIEILRQAEADDKKFGGPAGRLNLFTTRLGDAMSDLGLSMFGSKEEGLRQIEEMKDGFVADLMNDGMTEKEARKFLDSNFGKSDKIFQDTLKSLGVFRDETDAANLERLAINETVLTYALANSLKDKDRLTQKDIQMAKDLVNIFPLLRGQKQVIKSLEAVNETILSDIKRLENDYQFAFGGDSTTIDNYRRKYGVIESEAVISDAIPNIFKEQSTQELLENF